MTDIKKTILVIDDDNAIRESIGELLDLLGYSVILASNGKEGILAAQEQSPDLILCDIMMPEMDGYGVLYALRNAMETAVIPFIFLTAKAELPELRKGMESGADDFLFKPFAMDDLVKAIDARLARQEVFNARMETAPRDGETKKNYTRDSHLLLMSGTHPEPIKLGSIVYIEALEHYSNVFTNENRKIVIRRSMKEWENLLPEDFFLRIHRSAIINLDYVEKFEKWFNSSFRVYLKNKSKPLEVSRRFAAKLRAMIRTD